METLSIVIGVLGIGLAISDMLATVFNPQGRGAYSPALARLMWRGLRRSDVTIVLAGPLIALTVIASWVLLVALG